MRNGIVGGLLALTIGLVPVGSANALACVQASSIAAGEYFSFAADSGGVGWGWGFNASGQLGDGSTTDRNGPVQWGGPTGAAPAGAVEVAAGKHHAIARLGTGQVATWGDNTSGELGHGTAFGYGPYPGVISGFGNVTDVAAGYYYSLVARSDGTAWSWGRNGEGELGDGTTLNRSTPVQVSGLTNVTAVAAEWQSLAVRTDGTVRAWGDNQYGELGDGTTTNRTTPVAVSGLTGVTAVAAGSGHSLALRNDGTVWAWGYNSDGQLGDGTTTERHTPVAVSGLTGVVAIAAGWRHSLAVRNDGTVWAWGDNQYGQLGDGTTTDRNTPARVVGVAGAVEVAAGDLHSLARGTAANIIWGWGYNGAGQLGDTTTTTRSVPAPVACRGR